MRHKSASNILYLLVVTVLRWANAAEDPARLVVRPDPSTVIDESRVSFFCRSDGNPLPNVQWKVNGKSIVDSRFITRSLPNGLSTLRIEPVTITDNNTLVSCSADNAVASPVYAEALLTVLPKDSLPSGYPIIESHPSLKSVEQGRTAHVSCRVQGHPRPKVLWLRDLVPIDIRSEVRYSVSTIGNPGALMIQNAREEDQGKYECVARNELGVTHSRAAHLYVKVRRVPPYFSYKLEKQYKVHTGGNLNLTCIAVGYPMPRVFWKKSDDVFLDDPHTAPIGKNVLSLTNMDRTENFTCVAVSKLGNIEASTTVVVKALPIPPINVHIQSITSSSVTIQWDEVKLEDGEHVVKYLVKYRQKPSPTSPTSFPNEYVDSNSFRVKEVSSEMTKMTVSDLEPYTLYEFIVFTVNEIGQGTGSTPREAQTEENVPSSPPLKVQARAMNRGSLYITWTPCEHPNGEITGYRILYTNKDKNTPTQTWESKEVTGQPPSQIYNLDIDSTYFIYIQARNRKGLSPLSNLATVITTQGIPGQPQSLSAKSIDSRKIQLTWERPLYVQPVTRYVIWMNSTDGERELTLTSPHEKYTMSGLEPNTYYGFRVAAESPRGRGPFCEIVVTNTPPSAPAGPPNITQLDTVSSRSLRINWTEPEKSLQNGLIVQYRIQFRPVSSENSSAEVIADSEELDYSTEDKPSKQPTKWETTVVEGNVGSYTLDNLQIYTVYEVTVAAATKQGFGPESGAQRKRTAEDAAGEVILPVPSAPRNLRVQLTNANEVKLSWDPPLSSNGHLRGFYVYKEKLLNGVPVHDKLNKVAAIQDPSRTDYLVDKLDPNTEYAFRVNAFNRHGDGEFSESQTIVTGGLPPKPPQIVSVTLDPKDPDEFPVKARIVWKAPELGPLESPIDRYNLWYRPEGKDYRKQIVNGTQNEITLNGLWLGRVYEIVIGGESVDGNSVNTTEQLVTPVGLPDSEPTNVQYEIVEGKMRISWEPPSEERRNGNISAYRAVLTPMETDGQPVEKTVSGNEKSVVFPVEPRKSYTFKVSASTMKGAGPFSPVLTINPDPASLVGPPTNVRVQATTNSSAVVQWDFEGEQVDGFVIKYMHEPAGKTDTDRWTARTVMAPSARYLEIGQLTAHKPYAFCVLAIRQNRQGSCSDPPTAVSELTPTHMVKNLKVKWKTSNSVMLSWEYDPPGRFNGFYLNHTGKKEYMDQQLAVKTLYTPGFKQDVDSNAREYLWINLRPHMRYTFHVGVRGEQSKAFWPKEVVVVTDPTGPPLVSTPRLDNPPMYPRAGQVTTYLTPASEEYGPISHYWIIVVPSNVSHDHVYNMDAHQLERATNERRAQMARQISATPTKKVKKSVRFSDHITTHTYPSYRSKRLAGHTDGVYVTARLSADTMRSMYSNNEKFTIGDEKLYDGFTNYPLEPNAKYRLMTRAFVQDQKGNKWEQRAPMSEKTVKLYTDSQPTDVFLTPAALTKSAKGSNVWLIGPVIALGIIGILIGMLICWWLRCNRKSVGHGPHRHGSITKVALSGPITGIPSETSKLLSSDGYGRSVMNPYEQMNGGQMESTMDLYPLPNGRSMNTMNGGNGTLRRGEDTSNYGPVPVQVPCLPSSGGVVGGHSLTHPPIPIAELASHIERLRVNNNHGFQQEFESIETGQHFTWEHSNLDCNKHKNRYANVVAYDHSRVVLSSMDGISGGDYVNANYIDGYEKPKSYIATQGPLPETFEAFWRMVWEEGSCTIVMLTNLEERSRIKCDQYWPSRGSSAYGDIQVTLVDTTVLAHYTMRTLRIQYIGESEIREIHHLQYTAWPDHGVPDHPTPFLVFLKRVRTLNPPDVGPIISHCSAGIGRTGAFIVIDCMLERLRYENTVDIYGCVTALRSQRSYMVQTEDQYIFIHDAVLDAVNSGSTEVPASKLYQHVQALTQAQNIENGSGIDMEFRHLSTMKTLNSRCAIANLPVNRNKNRQLSQVPFDNNRVILQMIPGIEGSDYINASWLDGYRERCAYIGAQGPVMDTVTDFWRMVWESDCAIIVMLTKAWEMGREKCCEYWPMDTGAQVGQLVVEPIAEYNMPQYILREFRLSDVQTGMSRTVRHFQYTEWPEQGAPKLAENFIDFIQQIHRTKSQFGVDGPIVVHCSGGAARTGVFVALAILIDRIRLENVVDVFTTVKLLRTERANMVQDKDHYHFLYQAALEYLASYDQYAFS